MLRLSNDSLRVYLSPKNIAIVWVAGWLKRRVVDKKQIVFEGPQSWQAVLEAFAHELGNGSAWTRVREIKFIVSSEWAHYCILPWNADVMQSAQDTAALASANMLRIYGEPSLEWLISSADMGFSHPQLVAGISRPMAEQLLAICKNHGAQLKAITPDLVAAFNGQIKMLRKGRIWFLLIQEGLFVLAALEKSSWVVVRKTRWTGPLDQAIVQWVDQEILLEQWEEGPDRIYLMAPDYPQFVAPPDIAKPVVYLKVPHMPQFSPYHDFAVAPALLDI